MDIDIFTDDNLVSQLRINKPISNKIIKERTLLPGHLTCNKAKLKVELFLIEKLYQINITYITNKSKLGSYPYD